MLDLQQALQGMSNSMIIKTNLDTTVPHIVVKYDFLYSSSLSLHDSKEKNRARSELKLKHPCLVMSVQIH